MPNTNLRKVGWQYKVWMFIFFPLWKYDMIEQKLEQLEQNGLRLEKACFFWFFKFVKSAPREVRYIFTYTFLKEWGMIECNYLLQRQYRANKINTGCFFLPDIFRITDVDCPISEIIAFRKVYFKHVIEQKIIVSLMMVFFFGVCAVSLCDSDLVWLYILICLLLIISIVIMVYYLFGMVFITTRDYL